MLTSITFDHFKGFLNHRLDLTELSVLIGANNAGKTTIVDALRLIGLITHRFRNLRYSTPNAIFNLPARAVGVSPATDGISINWKAITRQPEGSGSFKAEFFNGNSIEVFVREGSAEIFAILRDNDRNEITSQVAARDTDIPTVNILPPLRIPRPNEIAMDPQRVSTNKDNRLSSNCFRNQLSLASEAEFNAFRTLVEENWPTIRIQHLIRGTREVPHQLLIRTPHHSGELSDMGHGLQMWIQIIWFISRCKTGDTVVLDEPDIYLHPDLQRTLIRTIKARFSQTIATTHSVDIMSEVEPQRIVVIDKDREYSGSIDSLPSVQKVIEGMGSVHNFQMAKLWDARKFLIIEGKGDIGILKIIHEKLFSTSNKRITDIPSVKTNGWEDWGFARGASNTMRNAFNAAITVYSIFDSDYRSLDDIARRYESAVAHNVNLHIWSKKEIENFLLVPAPISRLINRRKRKDIEDATPKRVETLINEIIQNMEEPTREAYEKIIGARMKNVVPAKRTKLAKLAIAERLRVAGSMSGLVSGKKLFRALADAIRNEFGASISVQAVTHEFKIAEIDPELRDIVTRIEDGRVFDRPEFGDENRRQ
ncbi:MAG TPA: ATP-binding protein [Gammaproteobacteria bacterium]